MDDAFGVLATTSIGLIVFFGIIAIAFYVVYVIALAKLFKKAGEDGWKAIIPFYNVFVLIGSIIFSGCQKISTNFI